MNLYHCMIELRREASALAFATAAKHWLDSLQARGLIGGWHLYRRKFGLASDRHTDVLLMIQVQDMSQLDTAFRTLSETPADGDHKHYALVHDMIATVDIGLYRPYPDAGQREHIALI